ncbi:AI-2E family transporter [Citricoccus sp. NPDC079358]|uniref:AI-2E family transporter n=1 Tax=Citricoccus sp. NPDC079358 TaxID=3154653 RepID=UPI00344F2EF3
MDTADASGMTPETRSHRVWPRFLVIVLCLAGLVITLQFVQGLQTIIGPVFLGLNLVIIAYPLQAWLIKKGVHRFIGASVTVLVVVVVLLVFMALILWSASELVMALPEYGQQFNEIYNSMITWIGSFGVTPDMMIEQLAGLNMSTVVSTATGIVTALLSNVTAILGLLATVIMAVFFLAMDSVAVDRRMALLNTAKYELGSALTAFAYGVRRYWVVTTLFGLIVAGLDIVALAIIGVPMIWVWGVLSFLTNYIPNIGFIIGMIPPALLGLVEGGWGAFFAVVAAYSVLNFVIQSIIQPKFTGDAVGVIPTVSFLSLLFWAWILGPLGAILALPATLLLKAIMIDADPQSRWINSFIASDLKGMETRHRKARIATAAPVSATDASPAAEGQGGTGFGDVSAPAAGESAGDGPESSASTGAGAVRADTTETDARNEPRGGAAGRRRESTEA